MSVLAVALVVTGASLLVAEAHVASYGVLGVAGTLALAAGVAIAIGGSGASIVLAVTTVVAISGMLAGVAFIAARAGLRMRRRRALGGRDGLIGRVGVVRRSLTPVGIVLIKGELWRARPVWSDGDPAPVEGEDVVVDDVQGLTLRVRRAEEWEVDL